jgi:hypothetical protein
MQAMSVSPVQRADIADYVAAHEWDDKRVHSILTQF